MTIPGAGTHELGLYTEAEIYSDEGPVPILADFVDPTTGEIMNLLQSHVVSDGLVIEAYRVKRNSGEVVRNVGNTIREVRDTDAPALAELRSRAVLPIRELEREGIVRLDGFDLVADEDTVEVSLEYVDLTQAETREAVARNFFVRRRVF